MPDFQTRQHQPPPRQQGGPGRLPPQGGLGNQGRMERQGMGQGQHREDPALDLLAQGAAVEANNHAGRQATIDTVLREYDNIRLTIPLTTVSGRQHRIEVTIETPYRINQGPVDTPVGQRGYPSGRLPDPDHEDAPDGLQTARTRAQYGKATPAQVRMTIQAAIDQGEIAFPRLRDQQFGENGLDAAGQGAVRTALQTWLTVGRGRLLGVDCSGFVHELVSRMTGTQENPNPDWMNGAMDTGTGNMRNERALTTIRAASTLSTGDIILFAQHVEMIRSIRAEDIAEANRLTRVEHPRGSTAYRLGVVESSPNNNRQGPTSSDWLVVQTPTELRFYKNEGTTWSRKTDAIARRPNVLGAVPETDARNAPQPPARGGGQRRR